MLVIWQHIATYVGTNPNYWMRPQPYSSYVGVVVGVEYFFVLSGVVILFAHTRDLGKVGALGSYAWKRFRRVYPIYWVVLLGILAQYFLHPDLGAPYKRNPWVILSGFLLVHIHSLQVDLPVAWTLFHEVLFYAFFGLAIIHRRFGFTALTLWWALSVVACFHRFGPYLDYLFTPFHLLFGFGMLVTLLLRGGKTPVPVLLAGFGSLLMAASVVLSVRMRENEAALSSRVIVLGGVGATLLILGLAVLEQRGVLRVPHWLKYLGDASYAIYLIHYPVLAFVLPYVYRASLRVPRVPLGVFLVTLLAIGTGAGLLLHAWVEQPLLGWLARWNPGANTVRQPRAGRG